MRLLECHFGNGFKIVSAYIEKALDWNNIQPDDGKELQSYALFLQGCCNAAQDLSSISELDLPSNMKVIVSKLPYKLRESWRSSAYEIWERTKQRPRFQDLVILIEKHARILLDPIFGDIRYTVSNIKSQQPRQGSKQFKSSSKKSFVTAISPIDAKHADARTKEENLDFGSSSNIPAAFEKPCFFCKGSHKMEVCHMISKRPHKEKVEFLKTNGFCFACFTKRAHE